MESKKITVVVPVYNTEKYLRRCLGSILEQTYKNIEIIAVNDGSTDGSARILDEFAAVDGRITVISHEKNKGLFHARITGVKNAHGDYIGFVDSDDYISCDYYRTLLDKAEETGSDIVVGRVVHENENGKRWVHNSYHFMDYGPLEGDNIATEYWQQEGRNFTWHTIWNKLYSKRIWDKALPVLKRQDKHLIMTEDFVFSSVLFNLAERLDSVDYGAYFYFQNAAASTSNSGGAAKFRKNISDLKTAFDFVRDYIRSGDYRIDVKRQFEIWFDLYCYFWSCNIDNSALLEEEKIPLRELLDESLPDHGNEIKNPSYFYEVTSEYDNRYNDIIDKINSENIKCVSFDIFDTAILRPFFKPTDLFITLDKRFAEECPGERRKFSELRIRAEEEVRKEKIYCEIPEKEDVSLDDIFSKISEISNVNNEILDLFKFAERDTELKFCRFRKSVLNIYKAALQCEKKIYFTSDMYLGKDVLAQILEKNGYYEYSDILVSCGENASKRTGLLYNMLIKRSGFEPSEIVHIGDSWESDTVNAKAAGIEPLPYPAPLQCIQYNVAEIKSTHSCCPYSEPSGSMINFEKSLRFLGVRTALAVAANELYDNPFIPFNEWSEMNCSPKYLGYYALGMHMLGFAKWLTETAIEMDYETLLFIARDGYLPMEAYKIFKAYYDDAPSCEYIRTSRKASMCWSVESANDLYALYDCINAEKCTPDEFAKLISPVTVGYDSEVLAEKGIDCTEPIGGYGEFCRLIQIIGNEFFSTQKCESYNRSMSEYFNGKMQGKTACVDIGYSGRTQELLKRLTGKTSDAFYMHINDGDACVREHTGGFKIHSFYSFTPSITGGIREVLISGCEPSCIGYDVDGTEVAPIFEKTDIGYPERFLISEVQKNCLDFIRSFCDIFGEHLDIMDTRNIDISYPYEYFLGTLTDADAHMFSCLDFEDDMWLGGSVPLTDYWKECIRYHKLTPYYARGSGFIDCDADLSYRLFYKNGIDKKSKLSKALFWFAADRKLFKQKIKEIFNKNR